MARFLKTIGLKEKGEKITKKYEKIGFAQKRINNDSLNNKNFLEDLRQDRMCDKDIIKLKKDFDLNEEEFSSLIINLKYDIYLNREKERIKELNKSGDMKIPVLVYMVAILLMHIAALIRLSTVQGLASILIFIGSISFIFSDSCIAVNKWAEEFTNARLIIMTTYLMAQFYITLGVLLIAIV